VFYTQEIITLLRSFYIEATKRMTQFIVRKQFSGLRQQHYINIPGRVHFWQMTPLSITIAYFPFLNPCPSFLGHKAPAYSVSAAITGAHKRKSLLLLS